MSPVWVKLGDFGVSKQILASDTTAFHTQVATPVYAAPEVLGLDSNSETSEYTTSVDIWSLGCVVYELLVGKKLFASEGQVWLYFFGKLPFPEDELKGLLSPTGVVGISFLRSLLEIPPEDRPTAARALSHQWLADHKSGKEGSEDDPDEVTQSGDESTPGTLSGDELGTHNKSKKCHSRVNLISHDNAKCTLGGVALVASPRLPKVSILQLLKL